MAEQLELLRILLGPGGLLVALLIIIVTGLKKMWVFGWHYSEMREQRDQMREERDMFRDLAMRGTHAAEAAASVVQEQMTHKSAEFLSDEELRELARRRGLIH